jgi:molybdopterin synthase sulfur carrier subunit
MPIKVRVPTPLQKLTQNQGEVEVAGTSVKEALADLEKRYPGIKERLYDEKGSLRRFINFYVNEEDIRFLQSDNTSLKDGDELSIVPAIAGGTSF